MPYFYGVESDDVQDSMSITYPSGDTMLTLIPLKVLVWLDVVLPELFDDILAHIAERLFHLSRDFQLILWRNSSHLASLPKEVQHKLGNVPSCNRDMFDSTSDDVSFCAGDNMSNAITRINNGPGKSTVCDSVGRPGRGEGEHCLHSDIQALDVE